MAHGEVTGTAIDVVTTASPDRSTLAEWDALVAATPGSDVTQLSVWARVRALEGFEARYVFARMHGDLVAGAQLLVRRIPALGRVGYLPYGPLLAPTASPEVVDAVAGELAATEPLRMLFVQPPEHGDDMRTPLLRHGFRPSTAGIAPTGSVRLDLRRSEEEIRRGFAPRIRSWTRRWPEQGVCVRMGTADDVPLLARLLDLTARDRGFRPPDARYLRHLYTELAATGNAALFVGEVHGEPVTADLVTMCGAMVRGRLGGFDRHGIGGRLSVPAAARWEIVRWAKRSGYDWLDFGGLSEVTLRDAVDRGVRAGAAWPGADQAKMSFGGAAFRYPGPVDLIRPAALRVAYDAVMAYEPGRSALHRVKVRMRSGRVRGPLGRRPAPSAPRS
jgi:lipid II:glycine glycyltransferase (peptidoglycan interpeptide bridge formation enzyme)